MSYFNSGAPYYPPQGQQYAQQSVGGNAGRPYGVPGYPGQPIGAQNYQQQYNPVQQNQQ